MRIEIWKDIPDFEGYQVSNTGYVRSFWKKKHYPTGYGTCRYLSNEPHIMSTSDDGNGYQKLMLYNHNNGKRYCKKVHKLVADASLPLPDDYKYVDYTVDHIKSGPEGKLDNSVWNLQWLPRGDNIRKAYRDGICDARIRSQCKDIVAIDMWTGEEAYFDSIVEAARELDLHYTSIVHALRSPKWNSKAGHYRFEYAGREDRLLYGNEDNKLLSWIRIGLR